MKRENLIFLTSLIFILKEKLWKIQEKWLEHKMLKDHSFYEGVHLAYYEIFSTLNSQLIGFKINKKKINFNLDPDKDILSFKLKKSLRSTKKLRIFKVKGITNKEIYFMTDLSYILKEYGFDAKKDYLKNKKREEKGFSKGRLFGYWEIFSIIKHQLKLFQIDPKKVKFNFDFDKELMV